MSEKILKPSEVDKMARDRTGGAAYPTYRGNRDNWDLGMTLRDYFAAQAIPALVTYFTSGSFTPDETWEENIIALQAYTIADAMLEEREK